MRNSKILLVPMSDEKVKPEDTPDYWKAQLQELQKAMQAKEKLADEKEKELQKIREEKELEKLTAEEKRQKELNDIRLEVAKKDTELKNSEEKASRLLLTTHLISEYNLASAEFGPTLLGKFDPNKESIDDFAKRMKKDPTFSKLFKSEDNSESPPHAPGTHNTKTTKAKSADVITDEDKAFAANRWRNDKNKQAAYLERLKKERMS